MQVTARNPFFEIGDVVFLCAASVLDQTNVPCGMEIAQTVSALRRAEFGNVNVVAAARLANRMQGLMKIGHTMNQELKRFYAVGRRSGPVGQNSLEDFNPVNYAIVVILYR